MSAHQKNCGRFFLGLGAAIYLAASLIDYRFWLSVAHWFYLACLLPLCCLIILNFDHACAAAHRARDEVRPASYRPAPATTRRWPDAS